MEPATKDRIQRMIDAEAAERFPPDAVPQLALLHYGERPAYTRLSERARELNELKAHF